MKHTNYHNPIRSLTGTALTLVLLTLRAAGADPLDTWILRNPLPTPNNFQCVAYLNGRFLAGGDYDTIVSSPDGIHWSLCNTGTNSTQGTYNPHTSVKSITYGNGVFVAAHADLDFFTSSDGTNWIRHPVGYTGEFFAACFGGGQFVGCSGSGAILSSPDGSNWTQRASATGLELTGVVFGNGKYVAVGGEYPGGGVIMTSTNGTNWLRLSLPIQSPLWDVIYAKGIFVVVGGGATILTSSDGNTWYPRASGVENTLGFGRVGYWNGQFIIPYDNGEYIVPKNGFLSSSDGIHWSTPRSFGQNFQNSYGAPFNPHAVTGGNGLFVAVGDGGTILTSPDLTTWTNRTFWPSGGYSLLGGLAYGSGLYVGVLESTPYFLVSSDGLSWKSVPVPAGIASDGTQISSASGPIAYGNGLFVAGGPNRITTSPDGLLWASGLGGAGSTCLIYADGRFVTDDVDVSEDGANWHRVIPGLSGGWPSSMVYGNGQFVAVGDSYGRPFDLPYEAQIYFSQDATNWTVLGGFPTYPYAPSWAGVAYGNGQFVAITTGGYVLISLDGVSWPLPGGNKLDFGSGNTQESAVGITFGAGNFLAWGSSLPSGAQYLFASTDGTTWTRHQWAAGALPNGITYLNGSFWAYGNSSRILECRTVPLLAGIQQLLSGASQLAVRGVNGRINTVETSTDLIHWVPLENVPLTNGI